MTPKNRFAVALALLFAAASASAASAGEPPPDDMLFGDALTAESGERLRLAASLDPAGWTALRETARQVVAVPKIGTDTFTKIAKIDETIAVLAERLRPELRRAPLDALEAVAHADLKMLRAAESGAARPCAAYLWPDLNNAVALRRATKSVGRGAELERLRAIASARAHKAINPAYFTEQISEEQEQLRQAGLTPSEIAIAFSPYRPLGVDDPTLCRAAIRYLEAALSYPSALKATALAFRMSGDFGYGAEGEQ